MTEKRTLTVPVNNDMNAEERMAAVKLADQLSVVASEHTVEEFRCALVGLLARCMALETDHRMEWPSYLNKIAEWAIKAALENEKRDGGQGGGDGVVLTTLN